MPRISEVAVERDCRAALERSRARRGLAVRRRRRRLRARTLTVFAAVATVAFGGVAVASTGGSRSHGSQRVTTLSRGSRGPVVVALQRALHIAQTGTYDAATVRAVRAFQARRGLNVDGVAGPQTLAALGLSRFLQGAGHGYRGNIRAELAKIAQCESGDNPTAVSPDGRFRGKYQFDLQTWRSIGGHGDPAAAPEAVQDRLAAKLLRTRGAAPWPNCA